ANRRFRLLEVVESLWLVYPLPFVALTQVEELEILQVEDAVAADDLKADLAAGQARRWKLARNPQVPHHAVVEDDLGHDTLRRSGQVAEGVDLGEHLHRI